MKRKIGLVPQDLALYDELPALANLQLFAALHGISGAQTLVHTTHYMEEAERLCDRIVIVDHGRVVANVGAPGLEELLMHAVQKVLLGFLAE